MICCMTCLWVSSLGPPVSFAVSSPPDSVTIRRFSSRPHHLFNMADVDCIRTFVRIHYPTARQRLVTSRRHHLVAGCRHPAGLCRQRPAGPYRHRRRLRFSSAYHLFNVFHIRHVGRKIAQCSPNKDGGRRFEYTA